MADLASSAIVFLQDAAKPRIDGPSNQGVEYWECTGDATAVTVPITSNFGDTILSGSIGCGGPYTISGTNNSTITFTVVAATLVNSRKFLATLITKPVGS
jgi:hypothetical protein